MFSIGCNYWASHTGIYIWSDFYKDAIRKYLETLSVHRMDCLRVFSLERFSTDRTYDDLRRRQKDFLGRTASAPIGFFEAALVTLYKTRSCLPSAKDWALRYSLG